MKRKTIATICLTLGLLVTGCSFSTSGERHEMKPSTIQEDEEDSDEDETDKDSTGRDSDDDKDDIGDDTGSGSDNTGDDGEETAEAGKDGTNPITGGRYADIAEVVHSEIWGTLVVCTYNANEEDERAYAEIYRDGIQMGYKTEPYAYSDGKVHYFTTIDSVYMMDINADGVKDIVYVGQAEPGTCAFVCHSDTYYNNYVTDTETSSFVYYILSRFTDDYSEENLKQYLCAFGIDGDVYDNYKEAYAQCAMFASIFTQNEYGLSDLDGDGTPELVVARTDGDAGGYDVFTYKDGGAKNIDYYSGTASEVEDYMNELFGSNGTMGYYDLIEELGFDS